MTTTALLGGIQSYVGVQLPGRLPYYAAHAMSFKVNGNALQRAAFRAAQELPIYGSSELDRWADNRADAFFRQRPSGFAVFPVGRGGTACLLILQKIAAVADAARGKKVVIFLSPSWFQQPGVAGDAVSANLGIPQLGAWVFGDNLSPALKTAIARRVREFPGVLQGQPLLADAVRCLAEPGPAHRLGFALLRPLGQLQNLLLKRIDYGVILWEMVFPQERWSREPDQSAVPMAGGRIDWERLAAGAGPEPENGAAAPAATPGKQDREFAARVQASREFDDLTLLVRVLRELRMEALFISQPLDGASFDAAGVSAQTRRAYYERLRALLRRGGYPWRDFAEHEEDRAFFNDVDHPSAKAWIFYDREIDRFEAGK